VLAVKAPASRTVFTHRGQYRPFVETLGHPEITQTCEADLLREQVRGEAVPQRVRLQAALRLVQLEKAQVFRRRRVGRPANEDRECPDVPDTVVARLLAEAVHHHVFDHARA
jgi:hypothetical protein